MDRLLLKLNVGQIMNHKVHTVGVNATFGEIIDIVLKQKTNSVIIIDRNKKILGIMTRQDIAECLNKGITNDHSVKSIMVKSMITIPPDKEAEYARNLMLENKIAQLPVT